MTLRIEFSFPLNQKWLQVDDNISAIARKHKGQCTDSGAGFGRRDMVFEFSNEAAANAAQAEVKALNIEGLEIIEH